MPSVGPALVQILITVGVVVLIFSAGTVFFRFTGKRRQGG